MSVIPPSNLSSGASFNPLLVEKIKGWTSDHDTILKANNGTLINLDLSKIPHEAENLTSKLEENHFLLNLTQDGGKIKFQFYIKMERQIWKGTETRDNLETLDSTCKIALDKAFDKAFPAPWLNTSSETKSTPSDASQLQSSQDSGYFSSISLKNPEDIQERISRLQAAISEWGKNPKLMKEEDCEREIKAIHTLLVPSHHIFTNLTDLLAKTRDAAGFLGGQSRAGSPLLMTAQLVHSAFAGTIPTKEVPLGAGGQATVHSVRITSPLNEQQTTMAVKVHDAVEAALKELETLASLDHPNIIKVLAMRGKEMYLELGNKSLKSIWTETDIAKMPTHQEIRSILEQIADAVNYMHEKNTVHRDLKPDNIVLFGEGDMHIKLIDFGLATNSLNILANLHAQGGQGSPLYIAPEAYKVPKDMTEEDVKKRDVWAIGIMIWQLLTKPAPKGQMSHPLLVGKVSTATFMTDLAQVEGKITKGSLEVQLDQNRLSRLDPTGLLKDLMLSCLEIDPKKRISMREFLDTLNGESSV
ncbi:MAG: protein kinase [Parachlamydiaceae bacterium]